MSRRGWSASDGGVGRLDWRTKWRTPASIPFLEPKQRGLKSGTARCRAWRDAVEELGRFSGGPLSVAVLRLADLAEYLVCVGTEAWRRLNFQVDSVHSERCPHLSYPAQSWV